MRRAWGYFAAGIACLALLLFRGSSPAQTPPVLTFHVYENLVQIPVVVLNNRYQAMPLVAANRFRVSIDSGPYFSPPHIRAEGDDPIALSILIGVSRSQEEVLKKIGAVLAEFARSSLLSRDRISVYVEDDCSVSRVFFDSPADLSDLATAVDLVVHNSLQASHSKAGPGCHPQRHLWDTLGYVVQQTGALPGRRAVLAITDGEDEHSQLTWFQVRSLATRSGVAVFGLQSSEVVSFDFTAPPRSPRDNHDNQDKWRVFCELTGGLVFTTTQRSLGRRLREFSTLLRDRYIVEFRRPDEIGVGDHDFRVSIAGLDGFVRPAGISVPIADPKLLQDPNTVRSDPSLSPTVGTRRPLPLPPQ